jgi:CBS domain-containing protein
MYRYVSDLLNEGGIVVFTSPHATVAEAAHKMARHNVGSIVVLEKGRRLVGIFTERDLLRRVIVDGRDANVTRVSEVMTKEVIVVTPDTPRAEVLQLMNEKHIRHIPVADESHLLGVISLRDVLRFENEEKDFEIEQLRQYLLQKPFPGPATA